MVSTGNSRKIAPDPEELEISVFGPGYGECIVLHLGGGSWGVVDSCLDPDSKQPAVLEYFQLIGVNIEAALRFVIATHWHDDHMQGISTVFEVAKTALFACTGAVGHRDFNKILAAWTGTRCSAGGSGVDEIKAVLTELKKRQPDTRYPAPKLASADKVLWIQHDNRPAMVKALSPSDAAVFATIASLQAVAPKPSTMRRRLPKLKENDASVVISVQVGAHHILLGADLQVRGDRGLGWMAIVDGFGTGAAAHHGFKVPHHGSPNADHDEIWSRMLIPQPWAVTTPFVSGKVLLPSTNDCRRILGRTRLSYLTAPPQAVKFRDPNRAVEKTVSEATLSAYLVPGKYGHVRLRKRIDDPPDAAWNVEVFGHALKLEDYLTLV